MKELKALREKADAGKFKTWTLGGSNGRGITTPSGYYGDGFLADTDTKANAEYIAALHNANLIDRVEDLEAALLEANCAVKISAGRFQEKLKENKALKNKIEAVEKALKQSLYYCAKNITTSS